MNRRSRLMWLMPVVIAVATTAWLGARSNGTYDFVNRFDGDPRMCTRPGNPGSADPTRECFEFEAPAGSVLDAMRRELESRGWKPGFDDGELARFLQAQTGAEVRFTSLKAEGSKSKATCMVSVPRRSNWFAALCKRLGMTIDRWPRDLVDDDFTHPISFTWRAQRSGDKSVVIVKAVNLMESGITGVLRDGYLRGFEPEPAGPYRIHMPAWSRTTLTLSYRPEAIVSDIKDGLEGAFECPVQDPFSLFYNWNNPPDLKAAWKTLGDGRVEGISVTSGHGRPMEFRNLIVRVDGIELLKAPDLRSVPGSGSVDVKFSAPKPGWIRDKANLLFYEAKVSPNVRWRTDISSVN